MFIKELNKILAEFFQQSLINYYATTLKFALKLPPK